MPKTMSLRFSSKRRGTKNRTTTVANVTEALTPIRTFIKLWSNVYLSDVVCRIHDSATQMQGKGHN